jgi:hypothetical protein
MKSVFVITIVGILISTNLVASPLTPEDKIKSCMAEIYMGQSAFHQKNKRYTKSLGELKLAKNSDCRGIISNFKEASNENFVVEVKDDSQTWKIDSSKEMTKIK